MAKDQRPYDKPLPRTPPPTEEEPELEVVVPTPEPIITDGPTFERGEDGKLVDTSK